MRLTFPAVAALALTACSQDAPEPQQSATPAAARTPAATPEPTPSSPEDTPIPARFQGIWDYVDGTCNPASDLRIDIQPRAIGFYEAHGDVEAVRIENADSIVVDMAMEGEGEKWTMKRRFTLSQGGARLTPTSADGDEFEPMPLKKCEG